MTKNVHKDKKKQQLDIFKNKMKQVMSKMLLSYRDEAK